MSLLSTILRSAIHKRKQFLIKQLTANGLYQNDCEFLNSWTLSALEQEYNFFKKSNKLNLRRG
nr:Fur-regulated basic protein FbpA [uncultured Bacillus sp.]